MSIQYNMQYTTRIRKHIVYLYMYCGWRSSYQEGSVGILLTGLIPPHVWACPKPGPVFPTFYVVVFICVR